MDQLKDPDWGEIEYSAMLETLPKRFEKRPTQGQTRSTRIIWRNDGCIRFEKKMVDLE